MTPKFQADRIATIEADNAYTEALTSAYPDTPTETSRFWSHASHDLQSKKLAYEAAEQELFTHFFQWNGYNPKRNAWEIVPT